MTLSLPEQIRPVSVAKPAGIWTLSNPPEALRLSAGNLPATPWRFILSVVRGRYRLGLSVMVLGEAVHATCGILLPFALSPSPG